MANIVVTKNGNITTIAYGSKARNTLNENINEMTGKSVCELTDGVQTDLFNNESTDYKYTDFDTISGVLITTNEILFTQLSSLL